MKKILVVVDYQNDFVTGALGFEGAKVIEDKLYNRVNEYLLNGDEVIFTYDTHESNYLSTREGKNLPIEHCIEGTFGHKLYGKLELFSKMEDTIHINKKSFGLSPETVINLANEIGQEIDEIEITGIVTDMCVISNVVTLQSKFINAEIIVNENLCSSFDREMHNKAIDVMKSLQVKII